MNMEGTHPGKQSSAAPAKRGLVVEVWERLGRPAIGEAELREIQHSIQVQFGPSAGESPAAIARMLADEGAELRHPEVIEFDARWREARIESDSRQFKGLDEFLSGSPLRLGEAAALIERLEGLRQRAEDSGDRVGAKQVQSIAVSARQTAELLAKDRKLSAPERAEQVEITEWLKVWIQTPSVFADWLELRRRSPDFQKKFAEREMGL